MKAAIRILLATLVTGLLLLLWLRGTDLRATWAHVAGARLSAVLGMVVLGFVHCVLRSVRWRILVAPTEPLAGGGRRTGILALTRYTIIAYAVTFVVPGRLGEALKPALLWSRGGVPLGSALASTLLERLLDAAILLLMMVAFVTISPSTVPRAMHDAVLVAAGIAVAVTVAAAFVQARFRQRLPALAGRIARLVPPRFAGPFERLVLAFLEGFDVLRAPGSWWRLPAASLLTWAPILAALHLGLVATRIETPPTAPLLLVPLTALGIAVPTPAGIGGFHALMSYGLGLFSVSQEQAAAAAVVTHAAQVVPLILAGLYLSWREGLGIGGLKSTIATAREKSAA